MGYGLFADTYTWSHQKPTPATHSHSHHQTHKLKYSTHIMAQASGPQWATYHAGGNELVRECEGEERFSVRERESLRERRERLWDRESEGKEREFLRTRERERERERERKLSWWIVLGIDTEYWRIK